MVLSLTILPPQNGSLLPVKAIPTCHGYSLASVSTPPTILLTLLATPHLHSLEGVFVIGTVVSTGVVVVPGVGLGVVVISTGVSPVGAGLEVVVVNGTGVSPVTDVVPVAPGSLHVDPCILSRMKPSTAVTLAYTPGKSGLAQPKPHDTTPICE